MAENSGGVHCLKYGLTVHNVLGLKVETIEGHTLELGGKGFDYPGYDLLALLCGSEGMLGVVTEVTVRLLPQPPEKVVLLAAFRSLEAAAGAVARMIGEGVIPAGLEMMDALAVQATEDFAQAGYPRDAAAILLCELDGDADEVRTLQAYARRLFEEAGAYQIQQADDAEERERLWRGRKAAFPAMGRIAADYYCMDGTIPRTALVEVLNGVSALSKRFGLAVANVFHAGDGNLHPLILYDASQAGQLESAEALGGEILKLCVEAGGTVTGEHGVGAEKLNQMCVQFGPDELAQFERVKEAFDPKRLLNPGKAIPTLSRCARLAECTSTAANCPSRRWRGFNAPPDAGRWVVRPLGLSCALGRERSHPDKPLGRLSFRWLRRLGCSGRLAMRDEAVRLVETVRRAGAEGRRLVIVGSGSKAGKGLRVRGSSASGQPMASAQPAVLASGSDAPDALETMPIGDHAGIIDHRPEELVLTARCGTALKDVDALLAQHRQHLPFEPPMLDGGGTLGGAVATGWSGPGRPWRGSVRDAVLGVEMVNGLGQRLRFGGQVMKNVPATTYRACRRALGAAWAPCCR